MTAPAKPAKPAKPSFAARKANTAISAGRKGSLGLSQHFDTGRADAKLRKF